MIIFLYGPDDFRRKEKKDFFLKAFLNKYPGANISYFDGEEEGELARLRDFLTSQSMFETHKLALLEHPFSCDEKKIAELLKEYTTHKTTTLLLTNEKKPVKAFQFLLKAPVVAHEFERFSGQEWKAFLRKEAKTRGVELAPKALDFLAEAYEGESFRLVTELEKLRGAKGVIEIDDLKTLGIEIAPEFWLLVNGLRSRDLSLRMRSLETVLSSGEEPAKIFNILASLWREKIPAMASYDLAVKSGKLDYKEALLDSIL